MQLGRARCGHEYEHLHRSSQGHITKPTPSHFVMALLLQRHLLVARPKTAAQSVKRHPDNSDEPRVSEDRSRVEEAAEPRRSCERTPTAAVAWRSCLVGCCVESHCAAGWRGSMTHPRDELTTSSSPPARVTSGAIGRRPYSIRGPWPRSAGRAYRRRAWCAEMGRPGHDPAGHVRPADGRHSSLACGRRRPRWGVAGPRPLA
jgi:hypothetical protein